MGRAELAGARRRASRDRVDLIQPTDVPADIAATLLYPVTDAALPRALRTGLLVERARSAPR